MNRINAKKLKSQLSYSNYLDIFKALDIPMHTQGDKYDVLYTACHNKNGYDGSPKLLFYKDSKMFQCLTDCASTFDIIELVKKRLIVSGKKKNCSFVDAVNTILDITKLDRNKVSRLTKANANICNWEDSLEKFVRFRQGDLSEGLLKYDKNILYGLTCDQIYPQEWIDEGISIETMEKYQIGFYNHGDYVCTTIPCFDKEGNLIGIRVRHWNEEQIDQGKYRPLTLLNATTYKFPTNNVFFGINWNWSEIERTGSVTLVESEKAVMRADTMFKEKSTVLGLYGSQIGIRRRNALIKMGVKEVTLALDSDFHEIGDNKEFNTFVDKITGLVKLFDGYATVYVMYNNIGLPGDMAYKCSPFDFSEDIFHELWENRELMSK